jgi:hypothetical protein
MKKLKRLIWLQLIYKDNIINKSTALSPAANEWQLNFLKNINKKNIDILCIGHYFEPAWPKGKLFINIPLQKKLHNFTFKSINYLNLPIIRNLELFVKYFILLINTTYFKGDLFVVFNRSVVSSVCYFISRIKRIPWISIVADLTYPKKANGYVFLNWNYFKKVKIEKNQKKFFLDGGIEHKIFNKKKLIKKIIVYSGTIGGHGGLENLIDAFNMINNSNIELWITGKGNNKSIEKKIKNNLRIKFFGYVSKLELNKICESADIFVNPRPINLNKYNFPSKLLYYLNFSVPIISTKCGLSPKYDKIIFFTKNDNATSIKKKIEKVLIIKKKDFSILKKNIQKFKLENNWSNHINNFVRWIDEKIK